MKNFIYSSILILLCSCAGKHHVHQHVADNRPIQESVSVNSEGTTYSGSYVFVNQKPYAVNKTLNATLNTILPAFEGKTVQIELNTTEYKVDGTIVLPSALQSRVIVKGNHATLVSTVPDKDYVFYKAANMKNGLTAAADTYQDIRDLTIVGTGGGVRLVGGYQSKVMNVRTRQLARGVLMEFVLQGKIEDCHIVYPSDFGLKMTTMAETNVNNSQCNEGSIINCRILAKNTDVGIQIDNSNLVKLEGNIVEGGMINKGVYIHNVASTVVSCNITRAHFECSGYRDACVYIDGAIAELLIDEMYYSGTKGYAIQSECSTRTDIRISHSWLMGWNKKLKTESPTRYANGADLCKKTYWYIYDTDKDNIYDLFDAPYPYYAFKNNARAKKMPK